MSNPRKNVLKRLEDRLDLAWGYDISTPEARKRAMRHFNWIDHGILRTFWHNFFEIAPGVYRSNQPSPARIREFQKMGIKSILNLRGETGRSNYLFEKEACEATGIKLYSTRLHARSLARKDNLLQLLDIFETIEKPFVLHCKSGADRAGLASILYLLHMTDTPLSEARKQLGLRYIHIRASSTGILDHMVDAYEEDCKKGPVQIRDWIQNGYKKKKLTESYKNGQRPR